MEGRWKADEGPRNGVRTSRSPVTENKITQEEEKRNRGPGEREIIKTKSTQTRRQAN
jgi:hypothetical protein